MKLMQEDQTMEYFSPTKLDLLSPMKNDRERMGSFELARLTPEEEESWKNVVKNERDEIDKFDK